MFKGQYGNYLIDFLETINKPIAITFHSVIQKPSADLKAFVRLITLYTNLIFVMTRKSKEILINDYEIPNNNIIFIPHGTHIVKFESPHKVKQKYNLEDRTVLSTFGLLSPGKSIETALNALPGIVNHTPNVLYLIIGKTHPNSIENEIDTYRVSLENLVKSLKLEKHVQFVNSYLEINELLDYLKATDIYLFT